MRPSAAATCSSRRRTRSARSRPTRAATATTTPPRRPAIWTYTRGPASFDRRHAFVGTFTYRVPFLLDRGDLARGDRRRVGGQRQGAGAVRPVLHRDGRLVDRQPPGELHRRRDRARRCATSCAGSTPTRSRSPPRTRSGTATVGQILGPSFYQWDLSFRKNFRFGGRYQATPIFDVFNLFNRVNFGAPNTNVSSGAYGTINAAQPSRQFQLGVKFDF